MDGIVWTIASLMGQTAMAAALCNAFIRNGILAAGLASAATLLFLWREARPDPFWPFAAVTVVPVVIFTSIAASLVAYEIRAAIGNKVRTPQ